MNPETWRTLVITVCGVACSTIFQMWLFRWRKREEFPDALHKEVADLRSDLVKAREDIARIKGRINGHGWRQEV